MHAACDSANESVSPMGTMLAAMKNPAMIASLFNRFLNARNNILFAVGSIIVFVSPKLVEKHASGLLVVEAQDEATLASPSVYVSATFHNDLDRNEMKAFHSQ